MPYLAAVGCRLCMGEENIYQKLIMKYGPQMQEDVSIEEMSELTKALIKYRRAKIGIDLGLAIDNIVEEIADVEIMLEQLKIIHDCHREVELIKTNKLEKITKMVKE